MTVIFNQSLSINNNKTISTLFFVTRVTNITIVVYVNVQENISCRMIVLSNNTHYLTKQPQNVFENITST